MSPRASAGVKETAEGSSREREDSSPASSPPYWPLMLVGLPRVLAKGVDPTILLVTLVALLASAALLACWVARRPSRVHPVVALRGK